MQLIPDIAVVTSGSHYPDRVGIASAPLRILENGGAVVVRLRCTISNTEMHVLCIGEEFDLPAFSPCSVAQAPCLPTSNHSIWLQRWSQPSRNEATPSRLFAQCREVDRADDEMPGHPHRQMRRLATAEVAHFVDRRSRKLSKIALHITSPGLQQPCCALVNTGWTADVIRRKRGWPGENAVRSALRRVQWQEWNHQMQFLSKAKRAHRQ
jgi:hypothetical protein